MTLPRSGWSKAQTQALYEPPLTPSPPPKTMPEPVRDQITAAQLHAWHLEDVYCYVARRVRGREDAEDITAEVFAAAFEALPRFRGDVEPRLWLLGIARRKVVDWLRKSGTRREMAWEDSGLEAALEAATPSSAEPSQALVLQERRKAMRDLLSQLKDEQREALLLKYVEELSVDEIAVVMGRSKAAANSLLQRSRATAFKQGRRYFLDSSNSSEPNEVTK